MTLKVLPERQPLFVRLSDGSIQNKYTFKVLNKTDKVVNVKVIAEGGIKDQVIIGSEKPLPTHPGRGTSFTIFLKAAGKNIHQEVTPVKFRVQSVDDPQIGAEYATKFNGPKP